MYVYNSINVLAASSYTINSERWPGNTGFMDVNLGGGMKINTTGGKNPPPP